MLDLGDGTTRFSYPAWTGDPVTSDGRLLALAALVRWRRESSPATDQYLSAVRTLAGWACGPGRAFCGYWAWNRGLPETRTPAARAALAEMTRCVVESVVQQVLS